MAPVIFITSAQIHAHASGNLAFTSPRRPSAVQAHIPVDCALIEPNMELDGKLRTDQELLLLRGGDAKTSLWTPELLLVRQSNIQTLKCGRNVRIRDMMYWSQYIFGKANSTSVARVRQIQEFRFRSLLFQLRVRRVDDICPLGLTRRSYAVGNKATYGVSKHNTATL